MSGTYLKPSQTSKMKLLTKVVNASRDAFRTVFSIQNVFRTSIMALIFFGSLSNPKSMGSTRLTWQGKWENLDIFLLRKR